jgi:hypothetical protein
MPHSILLKIRIRIYIATRSMRKKQPKEKYLHQRLNPSRETIRVFSFNPMHMHSGFMNKPSSPTPESGHNSLKNCLISLLPNVPES